MTYRDVLIKYLTAEELTAFNLDEELAGRECSVEMVSSAIFRVGWYSSRCVRILDKYWRTPIETKPFWLTLREEI